MLLHHKKYSSFWLFFQFLSLIIIHFIHPPHHHHHNKHYHYWKCRHCFFFRSPCLHSPEKKIFFLPSILSWWLSRKGVNRNLNYIRREMNAIVMMRVDVVVELALIKFNLLQASSNSSSMQRHCYERRDLNDNRINLRKLKKFINVD